MKSQLFSTTSSVFLSNLQKGDSLVFRKVRALTILDMAREEVEEILDHKFNKHHRNQLQTYVFQLQVSNKYRKWNIIKRLVEMVKLEQSLMSRYSDKVPPIPIREQKQINEKNCQQILTFFEFFLNCISENKDIQSEKSFRKAIENLVPEQRKKIKVFKQISMKKKYGGRHNESIFQRALFYIMNWSDRFFTVTSQGVYYTDNEDHYEIKEMIPFSSDFSLQYGEAMTGATYGIIINASQRLLNADAENIFNLIFFIYFLKKAMNQSDHLSSKRFDSFGSVRQRCNGSYYIDSKYYFQDLYEALLKAKRQVWITGWMISPYFCLKRPDPMQKTRFDRVLNDVAEKGVKINIILYMEPPIALSINSQFTQTHLNNLHKNIKVLRHPAYILIPFLWSHHQKMVIIDQKLAFMGGLDIGYGRWDDQNHLLNDQKQQKWYGVDYVNYRKTDILQPTKYSQCTIDRSNTPRMPWHDIAIRIKGNAVIDLCRHFVQFWNYVNFQLRIDDRSLLLYAGIHEDFETNQEGLTLMKKKSIPENRSQAHHLQPKLSFAQKFSHEHNLVDNHDQQMQFYAHHLKELTAVDKMDKFWKKYNPTKIFSKANNIQQQLIVTETKKTHSECKGSQRHQILRSASMWGLGLEQSKCEHSILNAYIQLIQNAKQFIYIENQFFISVENQITQAIKNRIKQAYQKKLPFRVVIIIPSLPGFDGEPNDPNATTVRITLHYMFQTICRGGYSILEQLSYIQNLEEYIKFFNLRTHGKINNNPVTEIIYVHSKIMIIDDRIALIGSANINDRSLLGSRDSEIGIVVEDEEMITINIKGNQKRQVSKFAHSLRQQLYQQHFALTEQQAEDYMNNDIWWSILQNAHKNQQIYRQIFGCYPDNLIKSFEDIEKVKKMADIQKYEILSKLIKGNAVQFQDQFLQKQDLKFKVGQKEYYVPAINFN